MITLYTVLGLDNKATLEEIKSVYRTRAKACHPDMLPEDLTEAQRADKKKEFNDLTEAYDTLSDPDKRKIYDERGYIEKDNEARIREKAEEDFVVLFTKLIDAIPDNKIEIMNVNALVLEGLADSEKHQHRLIKTEEEKIVRTNKFLKRIRCMSGNNVIEKTLKSRITTAYKNIEEAKKKLYNLEMVRAVSEDYTYYYDKNELEDPYAPILDRQLEANKRRGFLK